MNLLREFVVSRVRVLAENLRSAGAVPHGATVGALREAHLRQFLADLVPQRFAITAGFITDPLGTLSPQLDFVVYDRTSLPPLLLPTDVAVVPVDAAVLVAEIKSQLVMGDIEQAVRQREALSAMHHTGFIGPLTSVTRKDTGDRFILPHIMLSYDSAIAPASVQRWFDAMPDLLAVCSVNSFTASRIGNNEVEVLAKTEGYEHVLTFIVRLSNIIEQVIAPREYMSPRLGAYLLS